MAQTSSLMLADIARIDRLNLQDAARGLDDEAAFADFGISESRDSLSFSQIEEEILALYDRLQDLNLESAVSRASGVVPVVEDALSNEDINTQLQNAERDLLDARAAYLLRTSVLESVLTTDPILKAVHSGTNANPAERLLHPLIDRRDLLSIAHTNVATSLHSTSKSITLTEAENLRAMNKNRDLTEKLLDLTGRLKTQVTKDIHDSELLNQLKRVEEDAQTARTRWKVMKSVVSAVIVGSGIDWARNTDLQSLVIDDEDSIT